jgi:hypothetical protein
MFLIPLLLCLHLSKHISLVEFDLKNQTKECVTWVNNHLYIDSQLHLEIDKTKEIYIKFENFNQLSATNCSNLKINTTCLTLNSQSKLLIEYNLNLTDILNIMTFTSKSIFPIISIKNILGFNQYVYETHVVEKNLKLKNYEIYFSNVNFDFYLNKTLITKEMCKFENFGDKQINYFWPMINVFFNEVFYGEPICPYVFSNTQLEYMCLNQIANSLIFKNRLQFTNIDNDLPPLTNLNKFGLTILELNIVYEDLSTNILCPHVFKSIKQLRVTGSPYKIQTNLFGLFKQLEYVTLNVDNLKHLFHQETNGIEWISSLNRDLNVNIGDTKLVRKYLQRIVIVEFSQIFTTAYTYPVYAVVNLCLFKNFPHKQLIIPLINMQGFECTCSLIWLIQNNKIFTENSWKNLTTCYKGNFTFAFEACHFEEKFSNCLSTPLKRTNALLDVTVLNIFFLFEWLKLVIEVYAKTFLSILGLITNFLIILVIKNTEFKKCFHKNVMYKHLFFNSTFNLIYCLLNSVSLVNICVFAKSSFCSSFYKTLSAQYFKIIFSLYLGNSLRLCCNFSLIIFSLSRFYISTSKVSKFFQKFKKLNLKLFYLFMFILCSLWSMFKLFEYMPNEEYSSFDMNFPFNRFDLKYCQHSDNEYKFLGARCRIFPILDLINNIFNNILFLFISIIIDICMIRFANKTYQHKKELFSDQKHLDEALENRKKIRKLIIINGILFFSRTFPNSYRLFFSFCTRRRLKNFVFTFFHAQK